MPDYERTTAETTLERLPRSSVPAGEAARAALEQAIRTARA